MTDGHSTTTGVATVDVSHSPEAADDHLFALQGLALKIAPSTLVANDLDADGTAPAFVNVSDATHGTVVFDSDRGRIVFRPDAQFVGDAGFDYQITDGTSFSTGHVTISVDAYNAKLVAVSDLLTTAEDNPVTVSSATLVSNDINPER